MPPMFQNDDVNQSIQNYGQYGSISTSSNSGGDRPTPGPGLSTRPSPSVEVYEEFFSGTLPCPTCRGSGRIPRDQENELVALIPVRDSRLKPRRTALYVGLAIFICLVIGALLLFFLLPRSIQLSSDVKKIVPLSANVSMEHRYVILKIRNEYNISNHNFFPIDITKMNVRVLFDDKSMVDSTNTTLMHVPIRGTVLYSMDFVVSFTGDDGNIAYFCTIGALHTILMPFQATVYTSYYGHTEETSLDYIQRVQCSEKKSGR